MYTIDRTDVRIDGIKSKIGGTEMNSNCSRLGRRRIGKMKNFGTSETMQTLMRKSVCAMLCLLLLLSVVLPV